MVVTIKNIRTQTCRRLAAFVCIILHIFVVIVLKIELLNSVLFA